MYFIRKRIKIIVVLVCVLVIGVVGVIGISYYNNESTQKIDDNPIAFVSVEETTVSEKHFYVDIKGSVNKPGVYFVSEGMIVNDVIELAGGLKKNAYTDNINLSLKLKNEMVIYVSNKNEMISTTKKVLNDAKITEESKTINDNSSNKGLVNINTASIEELLTVNGIGKSKAEAIVAYREKETFKKIEDIKNVSGIGDALFEQIKNSITV